MKIMMDIDGVLADFVLGFTTIAARLGARGCPYPTHRQPDWNFSNLDKDIVKKCFAETTPEFWEALEPMASASDFLRLNALTESQKHEVYYVTNRGGLGSTGADIVQVTRRWLRTQGVEHPVVIVSAKKGELALALGADYTIDDKAGNCVYTKYHSPKTAVYLLDQPYNQFDQTVLGSKIKRIKRVCHFLDDIDQTTVVAGQIG